MIGFCKDHESVLPIEIFIGIPGNVLIGFVFLLHKKTLLCGQGLLNIN